MRRVVAGKLTYLTEGIARKMHESLRAGSLEARLQPQKLLIGIGAEDVRYVREGDSMDPK